MPEVDFDLVRGERRGLMVWVSHNTRSRPSPGVALAVGSDLGSSRCPGRCGTGARVGRMVGRQRGSFSA